MTKKQAIKFLSDKKVYVKDKGEEIQKKLFEIGFSWDNDSNQEVKYTSYPFLLLYENQQIKPSIDVKHFYNHPNREITVDDILNITIEQTYRPFKDAKECLQEMLKHEPFGWVLCNKVYRNLIEICDYSVVYMNDDNAIASPFPASLLNMKFANGEPFGIKEDEA